MTIKSTIDAAGNMEVTQDNGMNLDGSQAQTAWSIPAGQVGKHLPTFAEPGARKLSKGDLDAMRDISADYARKVARGDA